MGAGVVYVGIVKKPMQRGFSGPTTKRHTSSFLDQSWL